MRYLLLLHVDEAGWPRLTPDQQREGMAAYAAFGQALSSAGALVDTGRLSASSGGATVRTKGGKAVVMDGPFAETKEQVAGYFIIEAPDMAGALDWAGRCPAAGHGAVEVRAIADGPQA
ncbi:MAG: YciI family protein [Caulobacterales bacterium]